MENKLYNRHMLTSWFMVAGWIIFVVLWKYAADKGLITFKGLIFGKKELPFSPTWGLCIASYSISTQIQHLLQSQISFWPSSAERRPSSASAHHCKYKLTQPKWKCKNTERRNTSSQILSRFKGVCSSYREFWWRNQYFIYTWDTWVE